jgi:iron complex transport system ATP-binding protein
MLEARNIHIRYGPRQVLEDISLQCEQGRLISVIGPNGAGKSTLLRSLNGGLVPSRGEVLLDGKPLRSFSRRAVARRIATVAQDADVRFPVTVLEFILGGRYAWSNASAWGWENAEDVRIALTTTRETELEGFEARLMNELSGGERQRAILARALATEAGMYLLDEPTANLDLAHQATILALVRQRCDRRGDAALVVTHDINLAAEFSDQVLLIKEGRTVAFGKPLEVLTPELLKEVFSVDVLVDAHPISGAPRITPVHTGLGL